MYNPTKFLGYFYKKMTSDGLDLENEVRGPTATSRQYYTPFLETMKSIPLSHFGYPNPFVIPHKKPTTAGWLTGDKMEFPLEVFAHSRNQVFNDAPIFVGGFDNWPELRHLRRDV